MGAKCRVEGQRHHFPTKQSVYHHYISRWLKSGCYIQLLTDCKGSSLTPQRVMAHACSCPREMLQPGRKKQQKMWRRHISVLNSSDEYMTFFWRHESWHLIEFTSLNSLMVKFWGEGMVGAVRTEQLQDLCDRGNAVWCKHPFNPTALHAEMVKFGYEEFWTSVSDTTAWKAKSFLQSECHCYEEHSWLLWRLRLISPLTPLFLFFLFLVCGENMEHKWLNLTKGNNWC